MDDLSSKLSIDTPENIFIDAEIAGFGTRCMAALLDYTILIVGLIVVTFAFTRAVPTTAQHGTGWLAALVLLQFIIITFYHLVFELMWNGQTPGKRRTHIRVVMTNGLPLTTSAALIRNLVRLFDFFPICYGVGLLVLFFTRHTQRLGDLAAKTVVIREHQNLTVSSVKENLTIRYYYLKPTDPIPHYIRIDLLTREDRRTIVDYLQRRGELKGREPLAYRLAQIMARKMDYPLQQELRYGLTRDELLLEQIARAFEVAERTGD